MNIRYTVVVTTFNDGNSIIKYLDDICAQTFLPAEVVIADGGSKDDTVALITAYAETAQIPIKVLAGKRLNIAQGYNEAIKNAKEFYIGISGVGNRYAKDYYLELAKKLEESDYDLVYSPIRGYNANTFAKRYNNALLNGEIGQCLDIASNHGALVKRSVFEELGYFYEKFIYAGEDGEFYSLVKDKGYKTAIVESAKVYWETPESLDQFIKQIKNYTIADLQIYSGYQWKRLKNRVLKLAALLVTVLAMIALLSAPINIGIKVVVCILMCIAVLFKSNRKKGKFNLLNMMKNYLPIYYTVKYRKFMSSEYSVKR